MLLASQETRGQLMFAVARTLLVATALAASGYCAGAAEIKVPQAHPEVSINVPAGWTVERSKTGVEILSPEKDSIIIGRTLSRDRKALDAWRKEASGKLQTFGVKFEPVKAAPKTADAPKPAEATKQTEAPKPEGHDPVAASAVASPDVFTFSGAPSLETPGTSGSNNHANAGPTSVEALTGFGPKIVSSDAKLPVQSIHYAGASMAGKPVDVELLIYHLPADRLFVMIQESGVDDNRAVGIGRSIHAVK